MIVFKRLGEGSVIDVNVQFTGPFEVYVCRGCVLLSRSVVLWFCAD